ncbi:MAG: branched-chain amino acid ABC transporter permease [Rhodobacteraceae bacterium]|nr:branched-chain amino acid ABC transporter permease [Paracoccaceae bacterium]
MDAIFLQILNGLDKGSAYALIALGLTLIFGTLGVVNFAHGALFMIGAFVAVTLSKVLAISKVVLDPERLDFLGNPAKIKTPYVIEWFGSFGEWMIDYTIPLSLLLTIPIMIIIGVVMERGLIRHFYKRPHADQILVTFGLAIVLQELIKIFFGSEAVPMQTPDTFTGALDIGIWFGFNPGSVIYPYWRLVYFFFAAVVIGGVFSFLRFTTFGMVVRAGMADRETVGLLGINIDKKFTIMFGVAAAVAGTAGAMYTGVNQPVFHMGMDFLVLSFVVVVVGGMGSLPGAVAAGFLLGVLESFASMPGVKNAFEAIGLPSIDQIIIYLVAVIILLVRPRGLMGKVGVMEE